MALISPKQTSVKLLKLTCLQPDKVELRTLCSLQTLPLFSLRANSSPEFSADQGIEGSISAEGEESQQEGGREMENIQLLTLWMNRLRWRDSQRHQQKVKVQLGAGGSCPDEYKCLLYCFVWWCVYLLPFVFHFWPNMVKLFFWFYTLRAS